MSENAILMSTATWVGQEKRPRVPMSTATWVGQEKRPRVPLYNKKGMKDCAFMPFCPA